MKSASEKDGLSGKEKIRRYTAEICYRKGFRKLAVEEICSGMAISKKTFYKYFRNKEDLIRQIAADKFSEISQIIHDNLTSDADVKTRIMRHFDIIEKRFARTFSAAFLNDIRILLPDMMQKINDFKSDEIKLVARLLSEGQKEGMIREEVNVEVLGKVLQGIVSHLANPEFLMISGLSVERLILTVRDVVLNGILTKRTPDRKRSRS